ncbi:MAG: response regulator transcription factor [Aquabacterium sp.]|nr:MAG: response regulator transcription factor [Aquabacterium sp.]
MRSMMDILLLEDDIDLGQAVCDHLEAHQHQVNWMKLCEQANKALADKRTALCLFDLRLPDGDALDVLRAMRARGDTRPVIVLTAQDQVSDRIRGLQAGADDYLVKPFDLDELLARIDAVARRSGAVSPGALRSGDLVLDFEAKSAWRGSEVLSLTAMEWTLLRCLTSQAGRIWSRNDLLAAAHPQGHDEAESNSLEVIISRLRRKLGAERISTHRGLGYRFET